MYSKKSDAPLSQAEVYIWAVTWACVMIGGLFVFTQLGDVYEKSLASPWLQEDTSYLSAVLRRSLIEPYQICLLGAWLALFPHAVTIAVAFRRYRSADSYRDFTIWCQTAFTSLGFLGTIVGVSIAVGGLEEAMQADDPSVLIGGLSQAFDTTFLGLGAAVTAMTFRKIAEVCTD